MQRLRRIKNDPNVKSVEYIWSCDFEAMLDVDEEAFETYCNFQSGNGKTEYETEEDLLTDLLTTERLNGFVLATVEVDQSLWQKMDMFPIFFESYALLRTDYTT